MAKIASGRRLIGPLIVVAVAVAAASVHAETAWQRTNYITFSGPVGLPGVTLPAGSYIFELADPAVSRDIVRVMSRDRSVVYVTAFTDRMRRPANWPADRLVTIDEPARGELPRVRAWYPSKTSNAYQFRYASGAR